VKQREFPSRLRRVQGVREITDVITGDTRHSAKVWVELEDERRAVDERTAHLRAMRLAREAENRS
jgi:hypothetical protein